MIKKIIKYISNLKPVKSIIGFSKRIKLPGFEGLPLYNVLTFFFKGIQKGAITIRASSIAFFFFLAIFPLIIFLFTLIPYIPIANFQEELLTMLKNLMPASAYEMIQGTLEEIITRQNSGLLSFGFLAALYFSTNGFSAIINAFNQSYHTVETRNPIMIQLISFLLVFIVSLLLIIATTLLVYSEIVLNKFDFLGDFESWLIILGRWIIIFALFLCAVSFIYYLGPASRAKWRFISAGSMLCTVLSIATSIGFAFYVNNFGQYNKLYGSIGTLIVMLMWIYFNAIMLLLGFELNASIHNAKSGKINIPKSIE